MWGERVKCHSSAGWDAHTAGSCIRQAYWRSDRLYKSGWDQFPPASSGIFFLFWPTAPHEDHKKLLGLEPYGYACVVLSWKLYAWYACICVGMHMHAFCRKTTVTFRGVTWGNCTAETDVRLFWSFSQDSSMSIFSSLLSLRCMSTWLLKWDIKCLILVHAMTVFEQCIHTYWFVCVCACRFSVSLYPRHSVFWWSGCQRDSHLHGYLWQILWCFECVQFHWWKASTGTVQRPLSIWNWLPSEGTRQ